jgi:hypothetical protein
MCKITLYQCPELDCKGQTRQHFRITKLCSEPYTDLNGYPTCRSKEAFEARGSDHFFMCNDCRRHNNQPIEPLVQTSVYPEPRGALSHEAGIGFDNDPNHDVKKDLEADANNRPGHLIRDHQMPVPTEDRVYNARAVETTHVPRADTLGKGKGRMVEPPGAHLPVLEPSPTEPLPSGLLPTERFLIKTEPQSAILLDALGRGQHYFRPSNFRNPCYQHPEDTPEARYSYLSNTFGNYLNVLDYERMNRIARENGTFISSEILENVYLDWAESQWRSNNRMFLNFSSIYDLERQKNGTGTST